MNNLNIYYAVDERYGRSQRDQHLSVTTLLLQDQVGCITKSRGVVYDYVREIAHHTTSVNYYMQQLCTACYCARVW
jgi:hypothetical protein